MHFSKSPRIQTRLFEGSLASIHRPPSPPSHPLALQTMAVPPFTLATAHSFVPLPPCPTLLSPTDLHSVSECSKVKAAQAGWNSQLPSKIALAYTPDSVWRNRDQFVRGRTEIEMFLEGKWRREKNYTLRKEVSEANDSAGDLVRLTRGPFLFGGWKSCSRSERTRLLFSSGEHSRSFVMCLGERGGTTRKS